MINCQAFLKEVQFLNHKNHIFPEQVQDKENLFKEILIIPRLEEEDKNKEYCHKFKL